jgi:CPA1 family monovalent cation:H+ antiporter
LRTSRQDRIPRIQEHRHSESPYTLSVYRQLRRDLLDVENAELDRPYHDGTISDVTRRRIQRSLDLEHAGLGEGP